MDIINAIIIKILLNIRLNIEFLIILSLNYMRLCINDYGQPMQQISKVICFSLLCADILHHARLIFLVVPS